MLRRFSPTREPVDLPEDGLEDWRRAAGGRELEASVAVTPPAIGRVEVILRDTGRDGRVEVDEPRPSEELRAVAGPDDDREAGDELRRPALAGGELETGAGRDVVRVLGGKA